MYERAIDGPEPPGAGADNLLPIWHVDADRALFIGPLHRNAPHAHSVPVYLAGLYGALCLRVEGCPWAHTRTAVIPAGVSYEFDLAGEPLAVLYLEPQEAGVGALQALLRNTREERGAMLGGDGEIAPFRKLYETRHGAAEAEATLSSLLSFARPRARRGLDARIAHAVAALSVGYEQATSVEEAARTVGLSPSRFQHLFADEVGVPFRRFRIWQRLRGAIGDIAAGSRFTEAAHRAGFFDQAHFARAFRQTFGAPATPSLRHVRRTYEKGDGLS